MLSLHYSHIHTYIDSDFDRIIKFWFKYRIKKIIKYAIHGGLVSMIYRILSTQSTNECIILFEGLIRMLGGIYKFMVSIMFMDRLKILVCRRLLWIYAGTCIYHYFSSVHPIIFLKQINSDMHKIQFTNTYYKSLYVSLFLDQAMPYSIRRSHWYSLVR